MKDMLPIVHMWYVHALDTHAYFAIYTSIVIQVLTKLNNCVNCYKIVSYYTLVMEVKICKVGIN